MERENSSNIGTDVSLAQCSRLQISLLDPFRYTHISVQGDIYSWEIICRDDPIIENPNENDSQQPCPDELNTGFENLKDT